MCVRSLGYSIFTYCYYLSVSYYFNLIPHIIAYRLSTPFTIRIVLQIVLLLQVMIIYHHNFCKIILSSSAKYSHINHCITCIFVFSIVLRFLLTPLALSWFIIITIIVLYQLLLLSWLFPPIYCCINFTYHCHYLSLSLLFFLCADCYCVPVS